MQDTFYVDLKLLGRHLSKAEILIVTSLSVVPLFWGGCMDELAGGSTIVILISFEIGASCFEGREIVITAIPCLMGGCVCK